MIRAELFYAEFNAAFAPGAQNAGLKRSGRKGAKWKQQDLEFNFRVNQKRAGIPDCPGEFWPDISWSGPRHDARDDGTVSYYQYEPDVRAMQELRRALLDRSEVRRCVYLATLRDMVDQGLAPQGPHTALFYYDERDARAWGAWFGDHIGAWLRRFAAAPETLDAWCWRVLWDKDPQLGRVKVLHWAVKTGDVRALQTLLREHPTLANAQSVTDKRGTFPLHVAAEQGQAEAARELLAHGADPSLVDTENDATALCWAAFYGRPGVATALLERDREINARNKHGLTPLGCALGGTQGRWKQFSDASIEDWHKVADLLRSRGAAE